MAVVQYKTPGVYVEELDAFPPSIVGVETAVPAFIGYTEKAEQSGRSVLKRPVRISSMVDYVAIFGGPFDYQFTVAPVDPAKAASANAWIGGTGFKVSVDKRFLLYNSLRLFYANGGGDCYIVSVGDYGSDIGLQALIDGLTQIADAVGPTMLVIPEAVTLADINNYNTLVHNMLTQCRDKQDRVAIIDVWIDPAKAELTKQDFKDAIADFRVKSLSSLTNEQLRYGMAYVPSLRTSIVDPTELDYSNFVEFRNNAPADLTWALLKESNRLYPDPATGSGTAAPTTGTAAPAPWQGPAGKPADITLTAKTQEIGRQYFDHLKDPDKGVDPKTKPDPIKQAEINAARWKINQGLVAQLPALKDLYATMAQILGILPASAAMAGVYTQNDALRGVWNAPANVGLAAVIGPTTPVTGDMQDDLNMPIDGLAVNAIRDFVGRGTLVWGARTLDGNSNDWRYIQVRRALIYIEQSVELALNKFVFAPNVAQTWVSVSSMIGSFLRGVWQAGGLMGATPAEAFSVQCGLGSTMTADDVLAGKMIVQIKLTMVHPAEFIVLTFQQQMQGGAG
jgi:phage tail sheath protein FI